MRKFLIAVGLVLALLVIAGIYLVVNLDTMVAERIERAGTAVAKVPVTVDSVDISLLDGTATVTNLLIANPPGFSDSPAIRFDELSASIDVFDRVVTRLSAVAPRIRVEGPAGKTNIDVLGMTVAPRRAPQVAGEEQTEDDAPRGDVAGDDSTGETKTQEAGDSDQAEYEIRVFEIRNIAAVVDLEEMKSPVELAIDELVFTDLHGTRNAITRQLLDQLTAKIMAAVRARLAEVATEAAKAEIERRAQELEEKAREKLKSLFD